MKNNLITITLFALTCLFLQSCTIVSSLHKNPIPPLPQIDESIKNIVILDRNFSDNPYSTFPTFRQSNVLQIREKEVVLFNLINTLESNDRFKVKMIGVDKTASIANQEWTATVVQALAQSENADAIIVLAQFNYSSRTNQDNMTFNGKAYDSHQQRVKTTWELYRADGKLLDRFEDQTKAKQHQLTNNKPRGSSTFQWEKRSISSSKLAGIKYGRRLIEGQHTRDLTSKN